MKCIACNEDIIDNSPYCPYCGEPQPVATPVVVKKDIETVTVLPEKETTTIKDVPAETDEDIISQDTVKENISDIIEPIPAEDDTFISTPITSLEKDTPIEHVERTNEAPSSAEIHEIDEIEDVKSDEEIPLEDTTVSSEVEIIEEPVIEQEPKTPDTTADTSVTSDKNNASNKKHKIEKSHKKGFFNKNKDKMETEVPSIANEDGYYTESTATKNEKFPVSKGEIIAKFILLGLLVVSIALFMIYVIQ